MKNSLKKLCILIVISMSLANPVKAAGIPTWDAQAVAQALTSYLQDLINYEEYIAQTGLNELQLAEAVKLYEQAMTSYEHMLRQMESLKQKMDSKDWLSLINKLDSLMNRYPGSTITNDINLEKAKETIGKVFSRGEEYKDIEDQIADLNFDSGSATALLDDTKKITYKSQIATNQQAVVFDYDEALALQGEDLETLQIIKDSLGDEDQLKTMQFLAEQNQKALQLQVLSMKQQNTALQYSNQLSAHIFEKQKENSDAEIKNLKSALDRRIEVDNSQLTNY